MKKGYTKTEEEIMMSIPETLSTEQNAVLRKVLTTMSETEYNKGYNIGAICSGIALILVGSGKLLWEKFH